MKHSGHMMMNNSSSERPDSMNSLVREEPIDVESVDANNDGKVFQDHMDWNVISDEPSDCPLCGMVLMEVSVDEAKVNLVKNGFEIKQLKSSGEVENVKTPDKVKKSIWNKYCPVSGMKISIGSKTVEYEDKIIGFCCPSKEHNKVFMEAPEKYIENLSDDGQTYKGNRK